MSATLTLAIITTIVLAAWAIPTALAWALIHSAARLQRSEADQ